MKIKRFLAMMVAATMLCGGFASCEDDEEETPKNEQGNGNGNQNSDPANPAKPDSTSNPTQDPTVPGTDPAKQDSTSNPTQDPTQNPTASSIPADLIAGNYAGVLNLVVFGKTVPNDVTYEVKKVDDTHVDVTIPTISYGSLVIPSISLNNIEVKSAIVNGAEEVSSSVDKIDGTVVVDGAEKAYTLSDIVVKCVGNKLSASCKMKYGVMPEAECSFEGSK